MWRKFVAACSVLLVLVTWCHMARYLDRHTDTDLGAGRRLGSSRRKVGPPIQDFFENPAEPDKHYVLRLTVIRMAVIFYVGPCVLFYGTTFKKATMLIQAVTAAGLWTWWVKLQSIAYWSDVPTVIQDFGMLVFFSSAVGFSMLSAEVLNLCVKGGLLGHMFIMRILDIAEVGVLEKAGCDSVRYMPALAIRNMNFDTWVGCTKEDQYYIGIFMLKSFDWFFVILGVVVATTVRVRVRAMIGTITAAMLGADFIGATIQAGIADIMALDSTPEEVAKAMKAFLWYRMFLQYALAGAGFYTQWVLASWLRNKSSRSTWSTDNPRSELSLVIRPFSYAYPCAAPLFKVDRIVEVAMKSYADKVAKHVASYSARRSLSGGRRFSTIDTYNLKVAPDSCDIQLADDSRSSSKSCTPASAGTMRLLLQAAMELRKQTNGHDDDEVSLKHVEEGTLTTRASTKSPEQQEKSTFETPARPTRLESDNVAEEGDKAPSPLSPEPLGEGTPAPVTPFCLKLAAEGEPSPLSSNLTLPDDNDDNATDPGDKEVVTTHEEKRPPKPPRTPTGQGSIEAVKATVGLGDEERTIAA